MVRCVYLIRCESPYKLPTGSRRHTFQGLVHRDIKPANILLEKSSNRALLTDFGLARTADDASLTRSGVIAGTPQFMSPEQAKGESIDGRSDLFSLGSVLYTMVTGRMPFRAESSYGVLRRITDVEPRDIQELEPATPDWGVRLVMRMLTKNREARFQTAEELSNILKQTIAHLQQPRVCPVPELLTARGTGRRLWWKIGGIGLACMLAGGGIHWSSLSHPQNNVQPKREEQTAKQPTLSPTLTGPTDEAIEEQLESLGQRIERLRTDHDAFWD